MTEEQVVVLLGEPGNIHSAYGGSTGEGSFTGIGIRSHRDNVKPVTLGRILCG
jgi:hypothetical protein